MLSMNGLLLRYSAVHLAKFNGEGSGTVGQFLSHFGLRFECNVRRFRICDSEGYIIVDKCARNP